MIVGGILGVLFVTILRRVMVEDRSLPFPESVAAAEIHKAGQRGADAAVQLFSAMGVGALVKLLGDAGVFQASNTFNVAVGKFKESFVRLGLKGDSAQIAGRRRQHLPGPGRGPGLPRRRLHHRARARRPELRGRSARLGALRAAARLLPRAAARAAVHGGRRHARTGRPSPATSTASSSGRSRWAGCSSAPRSPSSACARTWCWASSAGSPTCRSRPRSRRPRCAPSATCRSRPSSRASRSSSS